MKSNDSVSALFFLGLGLVFLGAGVKMGLGPMNAPGPGFFPAVIGGVLSSLSAALLLSAARRQPSSEKKIFWKEGGSWVKVLPCLFSLVFYLAFLETLGYLLTTSLLILFLLKFVGRKGWAPSILMALLVSAASYALFRMGLGVLLPRGFVYFW